MDNNTVLIGRSGYEIPLAWQYDITKRAVRMGLDLLLEIHKVDEIANILSIKKLTIFNWMNGTHIPAGTLKRRGVNGINLLHLFDKEFNGAINFEELFIISELVEINKRFDNNDLLLSDIIKEEIVEAYKSIELDKDLIFEVSAKLNLYFCVLAATKNCYTAFIQREFI